MILREVRKYIIVYFLFLKNCVIGHMEYRINFIMLFIAESGYLVAKLVYVILIYNVGVAINGVTPDGMLLFIGAFTFITGIYGGLFNFNFFALADHVRTGTLDIYITKPVSLQFISTLRTINFAIMAPNVIAGTIMIVTGWQRSSIPVTLVNLSGFILFLVCGTITAYSIFLLPRLLTFWVIQSASINEISEAFWDFNSMPMNIYAKWFQRVGTFIIPVFLINNFSPLFVLGKLNAYYIIWGIIAPVLFFIIVRTIWSAGLKRYTSASS